jgi:hypothetical protein
MMFVYSFILLTIRSVKDTIFHESLFSVANYFVNDTDAELQLCVSKGFHTNAKTKVVYGMYPFVTTLASCICVLLLVRV